MWVFGRQEQVSWIKEREDKKVLENNINRPLMKKVKKKDTILRSLQMTYQYTEIYNGGSV